MDAPVPAVDAPIPAVDQAKKHLQLPRLVQGHLNLDSNRLLCYCKIFYEIPFLIIIGQNHYFPCLMTESPAIHISKNRNHSPLKHNCEIILCLFLRGQYEVFFSLKTLLVFQLATLFFISC